MGRTSRSRRASAWPGKPSRLGSAYNVLPGQLGRASSPHLARIIRSWVPRSSHSVCTLAFGCSAPRAALAERAAWTTMVIAIQELTPETVAVRRLAIAHPDLRTSLGKCDAALRVNRRGPPHGHPALDWSRGAVRVPHNAFRRPPFRTVRRRGRGTSNPFPAASQARSGQFEFLEVSQSTTTEIPPIRMMHIGARKAMCWAASRVQPKVSTDPNDIPAAMRTGSPSRLRTIFAKVTT